MHILNPGRLSEGDVLDSPGCAVQSAAGGCAERPQPCCLDASTTVGERGSGQEENKNHREKIFNAIYNAQWPI